MTMTKDDIINAEIEQEHKEAEKRHEKFQNDVDSLINEIKTSQDAKGSYFKEVLEGKHPGKKLVQQKLTRLHFNLQMRFKNTKDFLLKNFTCIAEIMQVHSCRM